MHPRTSDENRIRAEATTKISVSGRIIRHAATGTENRRFKKIPRPELGKSIIISNIIGHLEKLIFSVFFEIKL